MLKLKKRLGEDARASFVLLRELLVYSLGWLSIDSDPGAGSFGLLSSGSDGETDSSTPYVFTSPTAAFVLGDIGNYIVLGGAATPFSTKGIYKIVAVNSATSVTVASGVYGASLSTAINVTWRLVDPSLNTDAAFFVVEAPMGTSAPKWQANFYQNALDTDVIRYDVGPFGGWSVGVGWTGASTSAGSVSCDVTPMWYFHVEDEALVLFTETVGGASVFGLGYVGACAARNPTVDDHFAVNFGGTYPTTVAALASDNTTAVNYTSLLYTGTLANEFTALPNSPFDLRRDLAEIALCCTAVGNEQSDRGVLRGLKFCSTSTLYRTFVDNGRMWVSLGNGVAVSWDGSVSA